MRLASRFGRINQIRRDRPLTHEELMQYTPSVFGEDKHTSRSEKYTYIPTITLLDNLRREGFEPFFACQSRVRDPGRRDYTKHMLRLRRAGQISMRTGTVIVTRMRCLQSNTFRRGRRISLSGDLSWLISLTTSLPGTIRERWRQSKVDCY